jgi:hypothetical protein
MTRARAARQQPARQCGQRRAWKAHPQLLSMRASHTHTRHAAPRVLTLTNDSAKASTCAAAPNSRSCQSCARPAQHMRMRPAQCARARSAPRMCMRSAQRAHALSTVSSHGQGTPGGMAYACHVSAPATTWRLHSHWSAVCCAGVCWRRLNHTQARKKKNTTPHYTTPNHKPCP